MKEQIRPMRGSRSGGDNTDPEVWLRLFSGAIAAGKSAPEATAIADAGGRAFRSRFPIGGAQIVPVAGAQKGNS